MRINGSIRPGIVHRLDKDTSGLLIVAKDERALAALAAQFHERQTLKVYLALLDGVVEPGEGTIDVPIGRDPRNRQRMAALREGRPARSHFRVLRTLPAAHPGRGADRVGAHPPDSRPLRLHRPPRHRRPALRPPVIARRTSPSHASSSTRPASACACRTASTANSPARCRPISAATLAFLRASAPSTTTPAQLIDCEADLRDNARGPTRPNGRKPEDHCEQPSMTTDEALRTIRELFAAAVAAVDVRAAVRRALRLTGDRLLVPDAGLDLPLAAGGRVIVVAVGKAAAAMAAEAEEVLGDRISAGLALTKYGCGEPTARIPVREAGHPTPDEAGLAAASELRALCSAAARATTSSSASSPAAARRCSPRRPRRSRWQNCAPRPACSWRRERTSTS